MPWKKGQSGNPGGRPKQIRDLEKQIRQENFPACQRAMKKLIWYIDNSDDGNVVIAAIKVLLERVFGPPHRPEEEIAADSELHIYVHQPADQPLRVALAQDDTLPPSDGTAS